MATKKTSSKSTRRPAKKAAKKSTTPPSRRWSAKVTTDSTKPTPGIFNKSAKAIAGDLVKKSVSPEGPGQGMRMLSFYENRAGKNLTPERKKTLERAKDLLREKETSKPARKSVKKSSTPKKSSAKKSSAKKSKKK